jgi:hypothetical protein
MTVPVPWSIRVADAQPPELLRAPINCVSVAPRLRQIATALPFALTARRVSAASARESACTTVGIDHDPPVGRALA